MTTLDLDKRRSERDNKPHKLTLDGDEWELPAKLPLVAIEDLESLRIRAVIRTLFGNDAVDRLAPLLDQDDLEAILAELYEITNDDDDKKKKRKTPQDHLPAK